MKAIGIVRQVDGLGRIVLPKELRRTLNLNEGDGLEIYVDGENIVLCKYRPGCVFCGEADEKELIKLDGNAVCRACAIRLGVMAEEAKHETA